MNTSKILGCNPGTSDAPHRGTDGKKPNTGFKTSKPGKIIPYAKSIKEGKKMIRKNEKDPGKD